MINAKTLTASNIDKFKGKKQSIDKFAFAVHDTTTHGT